MYIISKKYNHKSGINRALGKHIKNKAHYEDEMRRQGMVSYEKGNKIAEEIRKRKEKLYKPEKETVKFLRGVKMKAKPDGSVKLSQKEIDYLVEKGAIKKTSELPKEILTEGGFKSDS